MTIYGILKDNTNNGLDSEIVTGFAAPLTIRSNTPVHTSDSMSLKRFTNSLGHQRWEIDTDLVPSDNSADIFALNLIAGRSGVLHIRMPQIPKRNQLVEGLSLSVSGAYPAGVDTINIAGLGSENMPNGEFIKFIGDSKVYSIVDPGINGGNVKIFPRLRNPKSGGTQIEYGSRVTMKAYVDGVNSLEFTDGILSSLGKLKLVEAL